MLVLSNRCNLVIKSYSCTHSDIRKINTFIIIFSLNFLASWGFTMLWFMQKKLSFSPVPSADENTTEGLEKKIEVLKAGNAKLLEGFIEEELLLEN